MSTIIDEFVIQLNLDGTIARNEADKIKRDTEKAVKSAGNEFDKAGDKAKQAGIKAKQGAKEAQSGWASLASTIKDRFLGAAAAFTALYGVQSMFSSYLNTADAMGKFSESIGQNIEDVHAWSEAVIRSGGTAEGFQGSLKNLSRELSKMSTTGNSRAGKILTSVGIDAGGEGRARKSLDVLMEIADVMQGMSKEEAFGFGTSLGIDSGTIMLLQQGRDAVGDLIVKQKQLGVYTKEDAKITAEFNDAIADSKQAFMGFASILFRMVVPAFKQIVEGFTDWISYLKKHETAIQIFFTMVAGLITAVLIPALNRLAIAMMKNPLTWIVVALAAVAAVFEDLDAWKKGKKSALGDLWEWIYGDPKKFQKNTDKFKQTIMKWINDIRSMGSFIERPLKNLKDNFRQLEYWWKTLDFGVQFGEIGDKIGEMLVDVQNFFNNNFTTDAFGISAFIDDFIAGFANAFKYLYEAGERATSAVGSFFSELGTTIKTAIGEAINWALGKLQELAAAVKSTPIIGTVVDWGSSAYDAVFGGGGSATTNNYAGNTSDTKIGTVNVYTQATDANGIAGDIRGAMSNQFSAYQADVAYE